VTDEDVDFVGNALANYWDMREAVPFVIIAQEPQVWNLRVGYAGSADVLVWFLPPSREGAARSTGRTAPTGRRDQVETIDEVGGYICARGLEDQPGRLHRPRRAGHRLPAGQFIGRGDQIDDRLSRILKATMKGLIIKIRPDGWEIDTFEYREDVSLAFFGEIAIARFLLTHEHPSSLFNETISGQAEKPWRPAA
jgi:hypothetical protein